MKLAAALILVALLALGAFPVYAGTGPTDAGSPALRAAASVQEGDDGGPDILTMALATTAVIAGAAALTTLLYLLRKAIGFDPHRPPDRDEDGGEH